MVVWKKTLYVDILLNIPQSPSMLPTFHMCIHEATAHKAIRLTSSLNDLFINTSTSLFISIMTLLVGTRDLRTLWSPPKVSGGGGGKQKRQNYQIYLVGFECVVKDIEAWLQLFTSYPAL
jgi:hypothetical protein